MGAIERFARAAGFNVQKNYNKNKKNAILVRMAELRKEGRYLPGKIRRK